MPVEQVTLRWVPSVIIDTLDWTNLDVIVVGFKSFPGHALELKS